MKIGFILMEDFFQKKDIGSSRIRGHWIIEASKKMDSKHQFELYKQGGEYDVLIFQKAYWKEMAKEFKGIKILDICDPDWLDGAEVVSFIKNIDAITTSTEELAKVIRQFTDKPVICIPDRINFNGLPAPKFHKGKAKKAVWFGYSHNAWILDPTFMKIKNLGLTLKIISDNNINISECDSEFVKWEKDTVDKEIQETDFVLLPESVKGRNLYKSNNKSLHAWALGMPVAKTPQDMERFMDEKERQKEVELKYKEVKEKWNIERSVVKLNNLINSLK